jgi:hypothetical protein
LFGLEPASMDRPREELRIRCAGNPMAVTRLVRANPL